jgi:hypothetical protein
MPEFQQTEETMRAIKRTLQVLFIVVAVCTFTGSYANSVLSLQISSESGTPGALIHFNGTTDTITFSPAGGAPPTYDFVISNSSSGSLISKKGNIVGSFAVGPITSTPTVFGPLQSAFVTGTGTFSIFDGSNTLSADLALNSVFTLGTTVGLNFNALANLSNFSYASGSDPALLSLLGSPDGTLTLSSQFLAPKTLTQLMATGAANSSTYSGSLTATVPEPSSFLLLAAGLIAAAVSMRRRSIP